MAWIKFTALGTIAALAFTAATARADDAADWAKARKTHYAAYRAAHPKPDAEIAAIKAKTAAMVASYGRPLETDLDKPPAIWRAVDKPLELWDGEDAPKMIVIPAGEYSMGAAPNEVGRAPMEGPRHRVRIGYSFAVSATSVTVGEFARFVAETKRDMGEACFTMENGEYRLRGNRDWRHPGFAQTENGPVLCVNYFDVQAYLEWLSKKTGHAYRLLSESETEYVSRAGATTAFWWGDEIGKGRANCIGCGSPWDNAHPGPVASFAPNPFGLYDTAGNALSWVSDCWTPDYSAAPTDGSPATGDCDLHDLRGGSWHSAPKGLRPAARSRHWFSLRNTTVGFRVARTL